jgi:hypothetical protein
MRITSILLSLFAVAALSAGAAHAENLVKNGDFSSTSAGSNKQVGHGTPLATETLLTDWTSYNGNNGGYNFVLDSAKATTTASAIWLKSSFTAETNGGNFFASDALYYPGLLSQSISNLTVGDSYTLTFNFALAQQVGFTGANTDNYWKVVFGDSTTAQSTEKLSIADSGFSGWKTATMSFTAATATQVLSFMAEGSTPGAPPFLLLDNVSMVAAVPEPATWGMLLGGMGLIGFVARRRAANRA